ncbi:ParB N-terminal domain-containing protein [Pantoea agglomerans]|uniref:DsbA family protein n=1 Tax=Enterobacter agglomerans TaxID=549 RepID=UPI0032079FEB
MSQQNVNTTASESKESSSSKLKAPRRPAKAKADKAAAAAVEQALEKIDIEMIPLSRLAVSPLNVRSRVYVQSRIESLAATIKNVGLLHNLIAHDMADGMLGVACGGRRLTALQLLLSQGVYQPDQLIPVKRVTEELARAASMVENGEREDMHPAEQIAGFRALADEGKTPAQIGDLMGYSSRHVQRCLKLIDLAPAILDELAADKITLEQCQALALADTHERQLEVWEQASGYYNASAEVIRKLITSSETAISHSPKFTFIGKDAYLAAGGSIRADLFSSEDEGYIDTALVEQLTLQKLQQIADAVQKEEGFAWAEVRMDTDAYHRYHAALYATGHNEGKLLDEDIRQAAVKAGVTATPKAGVEAMGAALEKNNQLARRLGIQGTPAFFVMPVTGATAENVSVIPGATDLQALQAAVEKARGGVKKGG